MVRQLLRKSTLLKKLKRETWTLIILTHDLRIGVAGHESGLR